LLTSPATAGGARQQRVAPYYEAIADAIKSFEQGADRNWDKGIAVLPGRS
jgi:hypothetical protein